MAAPAERAGEAESLLSRHRRGERRRLEFDSDSTANPNVTLQKRELYQFIASFAIRRANEMAFSGAVSARMPKPVGPPMTKRDAEAEATKQKLLQATIALMAERGVEGVSIAKVTERSGVTRGLPRYYFDSREGLIREAARLVATPSPLPGMLGLGPLLAWFENGLRWAQAGSVEFRARVALLTARELPPTMKVHVEAFLAGEVEWIRQHLEVGLAKGAIEASVNPETRSKVIAAVMIGQWVLAAKNGLQNGEVEDSVAMVSTSLKPRRKAVSARAKEPLLL